LFDIFREYIYDVKEKIVMLFSISYSELKFSAAAVVLMAAIFVFTPGSAFAAGDLAGFSLAFGTAENQLMYYNHKVEGFEEAYPMGPSDFCVLKDGTAAILDSFNNSVKIFDQNSKLINSVNILNIVKNELTGGELALSALAFAGYDEKNGAEFYAADAISSKIFHIASGKLVKTLGGRGEKPYEFVQLEQLFLTPAGDLLACDYAQNKIAVFNAAGAGVKTLEWNLCSLYADADFIYSITPQPNKTLAFYRQEIKTGAAGLLFTIQIPSFRIAKIIGVDKEGNVMAAFFDDSIQPRLMQEARDEYPAGYYTVAVFTAGGRMAGRQIIPVCTPLGNQFYYNAALNAAYYQNYNSDRAPEGDYKITTITPGFEAAAKFKKAAPDNITPLKKAVTKIEFGDEANKLAGTPAAAASKLPVLRCDKYGYFYILDRIGGKVLCVDEAFVNIKAVEIVKNIEEDEAAKKDGFDFCDLYAVSSSEIYVLDSKNGDYYHIKTAANANVAADGAKPEAAYDIKIVNFDDEAADRYDRIAANSIGDVMLYSSIDGDAIYFDGAGGEKKAVDSFADSNFFVMTNSDILAAAQNETSGEVKVKYTDFYGNAMKRFEKDMISKAAAGNYATAAHIIGADRNVNVFTTYFDGAGQKIALFSVTGDKICEFDFNAPNYGRYFESSMAVGADGTIYAGLPLDNNYCIIRIPYTSIVEFITKK
jgi:hypothetical protein